MTLQYDPTDLWVVNLDIDHGKNEGIRNIWTEECKENIWTVIKGEGWRIKKNNTGIKDIPQGEGIVKFIKFFRLRLYEIIWNASLMQKVNFINVFLPRRVSGTYTHHQEHQMLRCGMWFSAPSFWMGYGLESRCVGRVYGADVAVARHHPHRTQRLSRP